MNQFMVIINELQFGEEVVGAREIVKLLFESKQWLFSPTTPRVKSLKKNDKFVVYAAGKGNRCFLGQFALSTAPETLQTVNPRLERLARLYSLSCNIEDDILWEKPKPIVDMLPRLLFIEDKKNYGLYLRHGLKEISQEDYQLILK
jgi:hypothetical protein